MHVFRLVVRLVIGALFIGHGTQKLFGWCGGSGVAGTDAMMKSLDMHPPRANTIAAGSTETACGALLAMGLATPLAASGLIGVMTTAVRKVHWRKGPWNANGGYEYNAVLVATLAALVESGPGELSLDALMGQARGGWRRAAFAVGLGAAASSVAIEVGHLRGQNESPSDGS